MARAGLTAPGAPAPEPRASRRGASRSSPCSPCSSGPLLAGDGPGPGGRRVRGGRRHGLRGPRRAARRHARRHPRRDRHGPRRGAARLALVGQRRRALLPIRQLGGGARLRREPRGPRGLQRRSRLLPDQPALARRELRGRPRDARPRAQRALRRRSAGRPLRASGRLDARRGRLPLAHRGPCEPLSQPLQHRARGAGTRVRHPPGARLRSGAEPRARPHPQRRVAADREAAHALAADPGPGARAGRRRGRVHPRRGARGPHPSRSPSPSQTPRSSSPPSSPTRRSRSTRRSTPWSPSSSPARRARRRRSTPRRARCWAGRAATRRARWCRPPRAPARSWAGAPGRCSARADGAADGRADGGDARALDQGADAPDDPLGARAHGGHRHDDPADAGLGARRGGWRRPSGSPS